MKTEKKTTKGKTIRDAVKPVLFAITKSNMPITQRPIGECLLVTNTNYVDLIGVTGSRFGEGPNGDAVISRKQVLFYTHTDLRQAVRELNNLVEAAYKEQEQNAQAILDAFKKVHEAK